MKDLFKKKNTAPKPAKPKKDLFGKKTAGASKPSFFGKKPATEVKDSPFDQFSSNQSQPGLDEFSEQPAKTQTKAAKKIGLFSKKPTSDKKLTTGIVSGAKAAQKPKSLQLDVQKLLPILIGLFALVVAALVAKMFLFNEEPALEPAPVAAPAPAEPTAPATDAPATEPTPAEPTPAESVPSAPTTSEQPIANEPAPTAESAPQVAANAESAPITPNQDAADNAAPVSNLSYEEFIQETEKKVYRERNVN